VVFTLIYIYIYYAKEGARLRKNFFLYDENESAALPGVTEREI